MRIVEHRGKWAVRTGGKRYSTGLAATGENRDAAQRKASEIVRILATAKASGTVSDILDGYLDDMPNRANAKTPSQQSVNACAQVKRFFGSYHPHEINRDLCRDYISTMRKRGRSDGTTRVYLATLKAALRWHNPNTPAIIEMPAPAPPRNKWLTRAEFDAVLNATEQPHVKLFLEIAVCTGARRSAILEMQWDTHIDMTRRTIWPGFKAGGKNRAMPIPMTQDAFEALEIARTVATTPWVIEYGGKPIKDIKKGLSHAYARANVEVDAPAHVLRHTAGSWMAQSGVPMLEISRRLGHSSISVTEKHYAHLHPDYMQAGTKALDAYGRTGD